MDVSDLVTYARQQYNATSDSFFSDTELYSYIYDAQMQLARFTSCIRGTYTQSTVASQQEYSMPSDVISVKRVTYDGKRLARISFSEDDMITGFNASTTSTATPSCYAYWNATLYLRPVPSAVATIKIFVYKMPDEVTATSVLEVPTIYHLDMADYLLHKMAAKDKNYSGAQYFANLWAVSLKRAKDDERKRDRMDAFSSVKDFANLDAMFLGVE